MSIQKPVHSTVPSENWDDDFEFHPGNNDTTHATHSSDTAPNTRLSTSDSQVTEDWDDENDTSPRHTRTISVLEDKKNITHLPDAGHASSSNLAEWVESTPGPSTPSKRIQRAIVSRSDMTENWDDDFEDQTDSPVRKNSRKSPRHHKSPSGSRLRQHVHSIPTPESPPESCWDDEFAFTPATPSRRTRQNVPPNLDYGSPVSSDDEGEFGQGGTRDDMEEDRTVTARSRRAATSRTHISTSTGTPPPPVPALPISLNIPPSTATQPFPRSPTTSVFSVPSGRDSVAYSYSNSTTHLRPTVSRSSAGKSLANLPPSPPIHKERERRRLRKKSRPQPDGVFELSERVNSGEERDTYTYGDLPIRPGSASSGSASSRPKTPNRAASPLGIYKTPSSSSTTAPSSSQNTPANSSSHHTPNSTQPPLPSPASPKAPLLSRIGSVKKWGAGVRKKRNSTTPLEVLAMERNAVEHDHDANDLTPRPQSSTSNYLSSPTKASSSTGWFFRGAAGGGSGANPPSASSREGSDREKEKDRERARMAAQTPTPSPNDSGTPSSKLIKRKSLGFVQIRKGVRPGGSGGGGGDSSDQVESEDLHSGSGERDFEEGGHGEDDRGEGGSRGGRRVVSMQVPVAGRHASYGGVGLGRGPAASVESLGGEKEKTRKWRASRSRSRASREGDGDGDSPGKGKDKEKHPEGSRSFMGSVRKISLVGRHKRTKSAVSLSLDDVGEGPIPAIPPTPSPVYPRPSPSVAHGDVPTDIETYSDEGPHSDSHPYTLLPPIELQPPSPPRASTTDQLSQSAPMGLSIESLLHPVTTPPARRSPPPNKPASPQSASLGRSTVASSVTISNGLGSSTSSTGTIVPRRNSLGDLKIPARISQAQVGLRRDLGMVREFAANVEQLKGLQSTYHSLVAEVQAILDAHAHAHAHPANIAQDEPSSASRTVSPNFFGIHRPARNRSNTNPPPQPPPPPHHQQAYKQFAATFYTINSKYRISWECAELLIELGGGTSSSTPPPSSAPSTSISAPVMPTGGRERAVTLAGDESKPPSTPIVSSSESSTAIGHSPPMASPPSLAWRASTGRHDLSQRQLVLLKEILNNPELSFGAEDINMPIAEEASGSPVNRAWRWGDAMGSTITLPSGEEEESGSTQAGSGSGAGASREKEKKKRRRASRLGMGMTGLRDMLRSLKRANSENPPLPLPIIPVSSTSLSTESSLESHQHHQHLNEELPPLPTQGRRRAKTSIGPESMRDRDRERDARPSSPYSPPSLSHRASPRRPSLASIFRLGQKSKGIPSAPGGDSSLDNVDVNDVLKLRIGTSRSNSNSPADEEDWDRMDSASDMDAADAAAAARALGTSMGDGFATVRGSSRGRTLSPYLQESYGSATSNSKRLPATPKQTAFANASRSSIFGESPTASGPSRSTRLSNVEELSDDHRASRARTKKATSSPHRRETVKSGSVRSMPPRPIGSMLPDAKQLAMTPENIKPLLENAREVHARLSECIGEIRILLTMRI